MKLHCPIAQIAAFLAASVTALAQSAPGAQAPADETVALPAFTVSAETTNPYHAVDTVSASRVRGDLMETPGSISVLTPGFLQDAGETRIYEALRYVAGVSEGRAEQFGDRQILRGFESTGVTIDNFPGIEQLNTDPLLIDRVELVMGPNAILAPTGAPGGSINVVTKTPQYVASQSATAILGWSDAQRINVDLTGPIAPGSPAAFRLLGGYQDGYLNRQGGFDQRRVVDGQLSYRISNRTTLTVEGAYDWRKFFDQGPLVISDAVTNGGDAIAAPGYQFTGSRNGSEPWSHRGGAYALGNIQLTSSFGDHVSTRLAANSQYNVQDDRNEVPVVPSAANRYNPYNGEFTPDSTWALDKASGNYLSTYSVFFDPTNFARQYAWTRQWTQQYGLQADAAANYRFGGVSSMTVAGASWINNVATRLTYNNNSAPNFDLFAPVDNLQQSFPTLGQETSSKSGTWQYYADERLGFLDDRLYVLGGLVRVDADRYSTDFLKKTFASAVDSKNLYTFGVLARPVKAVSFYADKSINAIPTIANNLPLWQEGQQLEFGVKLSTADNRLTFSAAHFQISQTNVTVPNPAFVIDKTAPQSLVSDIKDHGYEFQAMGGITRELSVIASLTFLHERDSLNRPVRAIAGQNAGLFLNYAFSDGELKGFSPFVGVTYVGRRAGEVPSPNFTPLGVVTQVSFFVKPLTEVNLGARQVWSRRVTTVLNVDNLTNAQSFIPTSRANVNWNDPLNVRLSTTLKL